MFLNLKRILYFPIAYYFRFFAKIKLARWKPRIIVVTGSVGKTTLFELVKSQLGNTAYYSDHANSTYGIPANILGIKTESTTPTAWGGHGVETLFTVFSKTPIQKLYVVEADCDRPNEGKFLATLLKPEVTVWLSSAVTHSANFDTLVTSKKFPSAEKAIAHEYGYFIQSTSKLAIVNGDSKSIEDELNRTKAEVVKVTKKDLYEFEVSEIGTEFTISGAKYKFDAILPEAFYASIDAVQKLTKYLDLKFDPSFKNFKLPPGRSTILKGINNSTIIDSSYNASKSSIIEYLLVLKKLKQKTGKPAVFLFGDMRELGNEAEAEHKEIATVLPGIVDELYCVGPLTKRFVLPNIKIPAYWFENARKAGEYIQKIINSQTIILVKGSQNELFLEEAIKLLLKNKADEQKLCRQSIYWKGVKEAYFSKALS